jgi:predicted ATPase/DNA-binding SARP family transcriptional activator
LLVPAPGAIGDATTFGILGPLEVRADHGELIEVPGARRRALLLRLLVAPNQLVSAERLREELWGGEVARTTLASNVSWLRRHLGEARLRTGPGAYGLVVSPGELDADRFESALAAARRAVEANDHERAVELFEEALGYWRGPALSDLAQGADASWATGTIIRLEEERAVAAESVLESRLALGEHQRVAPLARAAVDDEPLREQRSATLMLALYRSGRQAEALRAFQRLRAVLAEELGIEPSSELVALDEAIVLQKPELDWAPPLRADEVSPPRAEQDRAKQDAAEQDDRDWADALASGGLPAAGGHNLAIQRTSFVGRDRELDRLDQLLQTPSLVSIVGPGGIGKTRLATEAGWRVVGRYPAGVWLVSLAGVSDGRLLAATVASALAVSAGGERAIDEAVVHRLSAAPCLLVMDNCEHLLGACADLVARWLRACPELSVLATSRERLGLADEHVLRLSSLSDAAAVALLAQRAAQARSGFALTAANAEAMSDICRRLDGIPLALELVAARLASFSPAQVADHLTDSFGALDMGRRDNDERHRTLRAALDWSYRLLDDKGRATIRRLAVFRGGFSAAAAEAVADAPWEVLDDLVSQSLVEVDPEGEDPRFALLEPVRQHAWNLARSPEREETQLRHTEWMVNVARDASSQMLRDPSGRARRLSSDQANIEAAIEYSLERPDDTSALRIVGSLGYYWFSAGSYQAMGWIERALERAGSAPPHLRARALLSGAMLAQLRPLKLRPLAGRTPERPVGRAQDADSSGMKEAAEWASEAAGMFRADGSRRGLAWALFWGARAWYQRDEEVLARSSLAEALQLFRDLDEPLGVCWCLEWAARYASHYGRWAEAEALCSESLEVAKATGVDHTVGSALAVLGQLAARAGDHERSIELTDQAVAHYRRVRDEWQLCVVLRALSRARYLAGDRKGSSAALLEALDLAEERFDERLVWIFTDIALFLPEECRDIACMLWIQRPKKEVAEWWPDPSLDERRQRLSSSCSDNAIADVQTLRARIPLAREALARMYAEPIELSP